MQTGPKNAITNTVYNIRVSAAPVINGVIRLSFTGSGKHSTVMAISAPIKDFKGIVKTEPAKNAERKPKTEPSKVFPLLNGSVSLPKILPKMEAVLSPSAKIAIAALLAANGKINSVSRMPRAKNMGAVANS